jgi:hypothetical protein
MFITGILTDLYCEVSCDIYGLFMAFVVCTFCPIPHHILFILFIGFLNIRFERHVL